ncbi:hypothetical protein AB0F88_17280 [Streptosporangium sp. NPDC023963]|uniref:hypothetical protein n=1 Tax=Streptosporangium sp. NPDC023963 TaxID=3155608 RepID=UPI0034294C0D
MIQTPTRAETKTLRRPSLKHRALTQIGWHVLAGMDVKDATVKAATDVKAEALSKGWPESSATAIAVFVVRVGAQWAADLAATEARR